MSTAGGKDDEDSIKLVVSDPASKRRKLVPYSLTPEKEGEGSITGDEKPGVDELKKRIQAITPRAAKVAFDNALVEYTLGETIIDCVGNFRLVLYQGNPTTVVQCEDCDGFLSTCFGHRNWKHNLKVHSMSLHSAKKVVFKERDAAEIKNYVLYDATTTLTDCPNVKDHNWINFPLVNIANEKTNFVICKNCCEVFWIDREASGRISSHFARVTLAGHNNYNNCRNDNHIEFDGYEKLQLEKMIDENDSSIVQLRNPRRTAAVWETFRFVVRRVQDRFGNFLIPPVNTAVYANCLQCPSANLINVRDTKDASTNAKAHSDTHNKEKDGRHHESTTVSVKSSMNHLQVNGPVPLHVQRRNQPLPQFDLKSVNDTTSKYLSIRGILEVQFPPKEEEFRIGAKLLSQDYQSSGSSQNDSSQEFEPVVGQLTHRHVQKIKPNYQQQLNVMKIQIFQEMNCKKKKVLAIVSTYYTPEIAEDEEFSNIVPKQNSNGSRVKLMTYKPLKDDPWTRYVDTAAKDTEVDENYFPAWNLVWESPNYYRSAEGEQQLHSFRVAFALQVLAKARERLVVEESSQNQEEPSQEDHRETYVIGAGAEFRMENYDWDLIVYWMDFLGAQGCNNNVTKDDDAAQQLHKENYMKNSKKDCHVSDRSLLCMTRDHVPEGFQTVDEEEETQHENGNEQIIKVKKNQPSIQKFNYKLVYRIIVPFNNYYVVYVGVDDKNISGNLCAKVHFRGTADRTNYGYFRQYYHITKSFPQPLCYFHNPHPQLKLMTKLEWEGVWTLAHVVGKLMKCNLKFNVNEDEDLQDSDAKPFLMINSRICLPTANNEVMHQLFLQVFRYLFDMNLQLRYDRKQDKLRFNYSLK